MIGVSMAFNVEPISATGAGKYVQGNINDPDGSWKHAVDPYDSSHKTLVDA